MKVAQKKHKNSIGVMVLRVFVLLFLFFFTTNHFSLAQGTDPVVADSAATAVSNESGGGPSLKNISKNLTESNEELKKLRFQEIMSYIYMGVGFSVVIGIAWFTTVLARKRKKKEDEVRAVRMQRMQHVKHKHHPRR